MWRLREPGLRRRSAALPSINYLQTVYVRVWEFLNSRPPLLETEPAAVSTTTSGGSGGGATATCGADGHATDTDEKRGDDVRRPPPS